MIIHILGTGCPKCKMLENNAKEAAKELGLNAEILKVDNIDDIMNFGVMITPGLVIDNIVKSTGKVLTKEQIKEIIIKEGEK